MPVGQRTLEFATPALVVVAGMVFWAVRRVRHGKPPLSWPLFYVSFLCAWFMTFCVLARRLVGGLETSTFGSETIRYHTSHGNVLGRDLWVDESRVLSLKIGFGHPTGGRAATSDINGDLAGDQLGQYFPDRRPTDRDRGLGDGVFHEHHGVADESNLDLVPFLHRPLRLQERQDGVGRALGAV